MSEAIVQTLDSSAGPAELLSWRDAITPLGRSSRRRWAVAYALLLVLGGLLVAGAGGVSEDTVGNAELPLLAALLIVLRMLFRGTRQLTATADSLLDERERAASDRAFRVAYPLLAAVMGLTALVVLMMLPDFERTDRLVLWGTLWAIYLPTGVLAWREPDLLSAGPEWSSAGLSERPRDALLAVALGGALTLAFLGFDGLLALLPLIAVLTLLCGLARRARK